MQRDRSLESVRVRTTPWDIIVIGGGATGVGVALDAAARGYSVCLLEQADFGKATSSRSTKIIHGGVRYMQQGNLLLVMEGLKERGILRTIAPHIVHDMPFIVPCYAWWEKWFYGFGMKMYDLLAGKYSFGRSRILSRKETLRQVPGLETKGLRGGVLYHDGQFDDTRLLTHLCKTAEEQGATLLNYAPVRKITHDENGRVNGVVFQDTETGTEHEMKAHCVINAAGVFSDVVRKQENENAKPIVVPSQGVHLILDASFLGGKSALMVPKTPDGRVMFAIPWHGKALFGTTDAIVDSVPLEPKPLETEIAFILETAAPYLSRKPTTKDVLSAFAGIRPLVGTIQKGGTAAISRDYTVHIEPSKLVTVVGGKWTIYRKMGEDCVDKAIRATGLPPRRSVTKKLLIHGASSFGHDDGDDSTYGSDRVAIEDRIKNDPALAEQFSPALPITRAQVLWAIEEEMARTLEDVLSRRTRSLLFNAEESMRIAPEVAAFMAERLGKDEGWKEWQVNEFRNVAQNYLAVG